MIATFIKAAALTAMVAVGAITTTAATSASAEARDARIEFRFGSGHRGHYGSRYHEPRYARDFCDPRRAVNKASRMGVRDARIVREGPRRVAVRGFNRGHPVRVVFANQRGCPVINYR